VRHGTWHLFVHEGFTPEKYDSAIKKLEAAGGGRQKGAPTTAPWSRTARYRYFDTWESQETLTPSGPL